MEWKTRKEKMLGDQLKWDCAYIIFFEESE
jgi:hypothetical protein